MKIFMGFTYIDSRVLTCCQTYATMRIDTLPNSIGTEESHDSDTIRTGGFDQVRGMHADPSAAKEGQNILLRITSKRRSCERGIHCSRVKDTRYHKRSSAREASQNKITPAPRWQRTINNFTAVR